MGIVRNPGQARPFTPTDVLDKDEVIAMLRYEDSLFLGPKGRALFKDGTFEHLTDLESYYTFHRLTLSAFGFQTTESDVRTYRTIFSNYYRGPADYDAEVLSSVCYMRENKCVYYTAPPIMIGDMAPDAPLATLNGGATRLHSILQATPHKYVFVGAFSNS